MTVKNYQTGEVCIIEFKTETGWSKENKYVIEGYCYNSEAESQESKKKRRPTHKLTGEWTKQVLC